MHLKTSINFIDYSFYRIANYFRKQEGESAWIEASMALGVLFSSYVMMILRLAEIVEDWTHTYIILCIIVVVVFNFLIFNSKRYQRIKKKIEHKKDKYYMIKGWLVVAFLLTCFPAMKIAFS